MFMNLKIICTKHSIGIIAILFKHLESGNFSLYETLESSAQNLCHESAEKWALNRTLRAWHKVDEEAYSSDEGEEDQDVVIFHSYLGIEIKEMMEQEVRREDLKIQ